MWWWLENLSNVCFFCVWWPGNNYLQEHEIPYSWFFLLDWHCGTIIQQVKVPNMPIVIGEIEFKLVHG